MPRRDRMIVGFSLHPVVKWDDASRNLANSMAALEGLFEMTSDGEAHMIREELSLAMTRIDRRRRWYREHLQNLPPEVVKAARDGEIPWPDVEDVEGFVPRCTCNDRCLHEQGYEEGVVCICGRECPAHGR